LGYKELIELQIAQKTHEQFVKEYLSDTLFFTMQAMPAKYHSEKSLKSQKRTKT
jgi:hypothetical protein